MHAKERKRVQWEKKKKRAKGRSLGDSKNHACRARVYIEAALGSFV